MTWFQIVWVKLFSSSTSVIKFLQFSWGFLHLSCESSTSYLVLLKLKRSMLSRLSGRVMRSILLQILNNVETPRVTPPNQTPNLWNYTIGPSHVFAIIDTNCKRFQSNDRISFESNLPNIITLNSDDPSDYLGYLRTLMNIKLRTATVVCGLIYARKGKSVQKALGKNVLPDDEIKVSRRNSREFE